MMVNGIAGVLLGLLFGWMIGRPRVSEPEPENETDKFVREFGDFWDRMGWERKDLPIVECDDRKTAGLYYYTGGTAACSPIHGPFSIDSLTTHSAKRDPNAQWTHTGQTEKGD